MKNWVTESQQFGVVELFNQCLFAMFFFRVFNNEIFMSGMGASGMTCNALKSANVTYIRFIHIWWGDEGLTFACLLKLRQMCKCNFKAKIKERHMHEMKD